MKKYLPAIPAYGRDYKSQKEVKADWDNGKNFIIQDMYHSGYINKNHKPANVVLNILFNKLTKVCVIK